MIFLMDFFNSNGIFEIKFGGPKLFTFSIDNLYQILFPSIQYFFFITMNSLFCQTITASFQFSKSQQEATY